jgi:hypothetical protein
MFDMLVFLIMSGTKYGKAMVGQVFQAVFAFQWNKILRKIHGSLTVLMSG